MKRILTLFLISISLMATAQTGSFKIGTKTITYKGTSVTTTGIVFSDGVSISITVSAAKAAVQKAYLAYIASHQTVPPVSIPVADPVPTSGVTIVGTGSGNLDLGNISGKSIKIKAGTYTNIDIGECSGSKIDGTGVTMGKDASLNFTKASTNVELFGLNWIGHYYRAINIQAFLKGLYLHDLSFKNVLNYTIADEWNGIWDGTDKTVKTDWRFENLSFENCGPGFNGAGQVDTDNNRITGLYKNFKISGLTVKNCQDMGNVVWMVCDGYDISGTNIDGINMNFPDKNAPNGYHNGIFMITGNGKFYNNICKNHQGNLIRAWAMSFSKTPATVELHDNKAYNSYKYGALELQVPPFIQDFLDKNKDKYTFANAKVYSNIAGKLNVIKDWEGQMLDLYNIGGGSLDYHDNIGFEMNRMQDSNKNVTTGITNMINNMSDVKVTESNNKYYKTQAESGVAF